MNYQSLALGPIGLLQKLASSFTPGFGVDSRASVIVNLVNGKSWTGVPVEFSTDLKGEYIVLSLEPERRAIVLTHQIASVEVENVEDIFSFFKKPWMTSARFGSISKLQLVREHEIEWKDLGVKCSLNVESLPKDEGLLGAVLAWSTTLKGAIKEILVEHQDLKQHLKEIEVSFDKNILSGHVDTNGRLLLMTSFVAEAFDKKLIAQILNQHL